MDTKLYISKQTYTIQTIEKNIDFTVSPYILSPDGLHTDVTIGDWHYGYVTYFNFMSLRGWRPEPTQLTDTPDRVSYWDLGLQYPTDVEIEVEINSDSNPVGCVEFGIGNSFRRITTGGVSHFTLTPTVQDIDYGYKLVVRGSGGTYIPGQYTSLYIKALKVKFVRHLYDPIFKQVDLYDDIDIPVTYNVSDVRDISKKDSNWSLTFKLPNTQNNAQLFELTNDISRYNSTFEMLKQYPAFVEVGCNRTFEGYFKLTKVIINDNREIIYEGELYSNVIEFMKRLGTTTLRGNADPSDDLSFSDYTTTLTADEWFHRTDTMTWDTTPNPDEPTGYKTWGKDFYFAPIDKYNFDARNLTTNSDNQEGIPIYFDEFTPYLYYKEIWDRIFKWAGFSYVSDFIQNTPNNITSFEFDHLVYPATGLTSEVSQKNHSRLTQNWINPNYDNNSYIIDNNWQIRDGILYFNQHSPIYGDQHNIGNLGVSQMNCYNGVINASYYMFTATQGGLYRVNVNIPWKVEAKLNDSYGNAVTETEPFYAYCNDTTAVENSEWDMSLCVEHNGNYTKILEDEAVPDWSNHDGNNGYWNVSAAGTITDFIPERMFSGETTVYLEPGDKLYIRYHFYYEEARGLNPLLNMTYLVEGQLNAGCGLWFTMKCSQLDISQYGTNEIVDIERISDFYIGGTFDPTVILNTKRKKTDFITDIIKKFNLYIEDVTDKKDVNGHYYRDTNYYPVGDNMRIGEPILRIEPHPLYYNNEQVVRDWTSKTDVDTIEFNRIDDYLYNVLYFNDKDDKTYFIEDYNNYNYTEGEFGEEIIYSPFSTSDDNKTEVNTELGQTMIYRPKSDYNKYLECPSIITLNDDGTVKKDKEYNDRMLFACNVYPGNDPNDVYPWDFSGIWNNSRAKCWNVYYRNNTSPNYPTLYYGYTRTYILLDHFNIPFGKDTADLNFGWANWYYQNLNDAWATSNNCYNVFYKQMIDDCNSPEARLMKCKMYLKSSDIRDLKLSDIILVNNVAYHINKIKQWKSEYEPVEVELIKIIQSTSKSNQPILKKNNPPKMEIVTLNTLKELIESQNKAINQISKQVEKLDGTIKKMDEQLIKLDERVKKLEGGGTETSEDGSNPDKDENNKDDYD